MQTKNLNRSVRRYNRTRAIQHAFDIYWNKWGRGNDTFKEVFTEEGFLTYWSAKTYVDVDNPTLDTNEARFSHEDKYRQHVLGIVSQAADNLRLCSCWMCSGYKKYEKTHHMIREEMRDADDWNEVWNEDSWEDAAFNPDISASPS